MIENLKKDEFSKSIILFTAREFQIFLLNNKILLLRAFDRLDRLRCEPSMVDYSGFWQKVFPSFYEKSNSIIDIGGIDFFQHFVILIKTQISNDDSFKNTALFSHTQMVNSIIDQHYNNLILLFEDPTYQKIYLSDQIKVNDKDKGLEQKVFLKNYTSKI